jgi:aspartate racemase
MEGPVYPPKLAAKGIDFETPPAKDRERINTIIFDELVNGRFTAESLAFFQTAIAAHGQEGCDAVVLGCTEIPLLVPPEASPLPTLDSTRLLARAAVERALA